MIPKVSILVSFYNSSKYIEKCARSLFEQSFKDIEFIFVNDSSTDDSIEKLKNVITQFPTIKDQIRIVNHDINKGSGAARNTGVIEANGDYIAAVDSDDYIESDMIETLYEKAISENADIIISDLFMEYNNRTEYVVDYLSNNENDHFEDILRNHESHTFLCNKLIKSDLYKRPECIVPVGLNYMEDRHILTRQFFYARKIVKVNKAFYHYIHYNPNSITKAKGKMHFDNTILFWNELDNFLLKENIFNKYLKITERSKVEIKVHLMIETNSSQLRKEYANIFLKEEKKCFSSFRKGEKLMLLLVRLHLFAIAQLFHNYLVWRNKKSKRTI
jgi:glycosyltransferase involved in cell wall biosynthesis